MSMGDRLLAIAIVVAIMGGVFGLMTGGMTTMFGQMAEAAPVTAS